MAAILFLVVISLVAIVAPVITPETYSGYDFTQGSLHPHIGWRYLLGTDVYGHSILMYLILGARGTLMITAGSALVALGVGGITAMFAAALGSWCRYIFTGVVALAMTLPLFPLALVLVAYVAGGSPWWIMLILGLATAPGVCEHVSNLLDRRLADRRDDVALVSGAPVSGIVLGHVLPDLLRRSVGYVALLLITLIGLETTIDFFGLGLRPPDVSWGTALAGASNYFGAGLWWWYLFPGILIFLTTLSLVVVADGLEDVQGTGFGEATSRTD